MLSFTISSKLRSSLKAREAMPFCGLELEIADRNEATALATLPPLIQKSDDGHPECLINVSLDILDIFQANRKSDVILCHAGLGLFFGRELLMGG